ncbi:MAG: KpsF/GutQ family sugar-phosphate isomerase [Candidatus Omnitrophica bacterium]|nr:KpsF/GutQ family sugar-phosphate isomerase [Candidatus Omnitrophota bacterium]
MPIKRAKEVLEIEARSIRALVSRLDTQFSKAVDVLAKCQGRVVVAGMGKTGIIARKISATLSSTGTPSIYMHSAEAVHGDLGQVAREDVVILISSSGETEETVRLLPSLKKIGCRTIAMTGGMKSSLAKYCDLVLDVGVEKEGCPLGLAPMASTTATLAMGDALAACLIDRKNFRREDFAFYHPGGSLGRRLVLRVEDIMRKGTHFARVTEDTTVKDVLLAITEARCGSACIVDRKKKFVGIFTDGDLRRYIETDPQLLSRQVGRVMTRNPLTIKRERLAAEAFEILMQKKVDELPVLDGDGKLVGLLDVQDLLRAGLAR